MSQTSTTISGLELPDVLRKRMAAYAVRYCIVKLAHHKELAERKQIAHSRLVEGLNTLRDLSDVYFESVSQAERIAHEAFDVLDTAVNHHYNLVNAKKQKATRSKLG